MASTRRCLSTHDWSERVLLRHIAELEASLRSGLQDRGTQPNWPRFLVRKSLEHRRKLLATIRSQSC
jgi:hypothetical protein